MKKQFLGQNLLFVFFFFLFISVNTGCDNSSTPSRHNDPTPPTVSSSLTSINFGNTVYNSEEPEQEITISNTGDDTLNISSVELSTANTTDFSISDDNCSSAVLNKNESCTFTTVFEPKSPGGKSGEVTISSNDPDSPSCNISLNGNGTRVFTITFDDNPLAPDSYYGGAGSGAGDFISNDITFPHNCDAYSWSGFTYSNMTDTTTAGYKNQFSVYTQDAVSGQPGGHSGSSNFCISYIMIDYMSSGFPPIPNVIDFDIETKVSGAYFTNTTYAYLSMLTGDKFAKKFGGPTGNDEDWFLLTITGKDSEGTVTNTIQFYLADFRFADNANDYMIDQWTWIDLSSLGDIHSLEFVLTSSDTGSYGMNTPGYFAMDDLIIIQ